MFRKNLGKYKILIGKISWKIWIVMLMLVTGLGIGAKYYVNKTSNKVTYETEVATRGTLVTTKSASGTITSGNYNNVTTKTSGIVSKVYVTNGDKVQKGQKIAEVTLDDYAKERQTAAWVSYLESKEALLAANNSKAVSDIDMWKARQAVIDAQEAVDDMKDNDTNPATSAVYTEGERMIINKTLDQTRLAFKTNESMYLNSDADISNSRAKVAAALRNYQENSATILSPADGEITDLALAQGLIVSASSTTNSTNGATIVSAQTIAKINDNDNQLIATVNLSEIDILSVKANQKVTIKLDAYEDKSFTGKVMAVNTSGSINSGVTSYPVTILLDKVDVDIYPNMAVNVEIITDIKADVIMIPTTAIETVNGQSTVKIMNDDGTINTVTVEIGSSNDSATEIKSGLNEGAKIVTATINSADASTSSNTTSPFSGLNTNRRTTGAIGGGDVRIGGPGF